MRRRETRARGSLATTRTTPARTTSALAGHSHKDRPASLGDRRRRLPVCAKFSYENTLFSRVAAKAVSRSSVLRRRRFEISLPPREEKIAQHAPIASSRAHDGDAPVVPRRSAPRAPRVRRRGAQRRFPLRRSAPRRSTASAKNAADDPGDSDSSDAQRARHAPPHPPPRTTTARRRPRVRAPAQSPARRVTDAGPPQTGPGSVPVRFGLGGGVRGRRERVDDVVLVRARVFLAASGGSVEPSRDGPVAEIPRGRLGGGRGVRLASVRRDRRGRRVRRRAHSFGDASHQRRRRLRRARDERRVEEVPPRGRRPPSFWRHLATNSLNSGEKSPSSLGGGFFGMKKRTRMGCSSL